MPKFMLVLADDPSAFRDVSPADMQAVIAQYMAWTEKIKAEGRLLAGEKLADEGGKRIRAAGGKPVVVDGPYAESKDVVGGFYIIEAAGMDQALAWAAKCPAAQWGPIEVRAMMAGY